MALPASQCARTQTLDIAQRKIASVPARADETELLLKHVKISAGFFDGLLGASDALLLHGSGGEP